MHLSYVWRMKKCSSQWVVWSKLEYSINLVFTLADGFYQFALNDRLGDNSCGVFSQSSTHVIHGCPEQVKDLIITYTNKEIIPALLQPMTIDFFFRNMPWMHGAQVVVLRTDRLIFYVCVAEILLHRLNLPWHYIPGKKFHPEFLASSYLSSSGRAPSLVSELSYHSGGSHRRPGGNSVSFRASSMPHAAFQQYQRFVSQRIFRIPLIQKQPNITMGQDLHRANGNTDQSFQVDSHIDLEITRLSSRITVSTQQDSSSKITCLNWFFHLPRTCWRK